MKPKLKQKTKDWAGTRFVDIQKIHNNNNEQEEK